MPDIPYKYLKDENWETFYPITGPSSVNGQIPVANGGTGADTAAGARANLGAVSAQDVTLASQPNDFVVAISEGGTGAQTAAQARTNLGLGSAIVESGTDGVWAYHKYGDGTYHAWLEGAVNLLAGTAGIGGYWHQTSSALSPPSFSQSVTSLVGAPNSAVLCAYVGHATDYSTYWLNGVSSAVNGVAVRIDMYGTW